MKTKLPASIKKNLQVLATETFKAKLNISPEILKFFFFFNQGFSLPNPCF